MKGYHIPQLVQRYVEHDMIQAHTELPALANARAAMLFAFLQRNRANTHISELACVVTSLVQLGLDTHDWVEMAADKDDRNMRSRQLKVLAGDYFSSRFYHLLAQAGQVDAIRSLSRAVCEVNRMKMTMVEKMRQWKITAEGYLQDCINLKQCLFHAFDERLLAQDISFWETLLYRLSEVEVMEQEQVRAHDYDAFEGSWSFWHIMNSADADERHMLMNRSFDQISWMQLMDKYDCKQQLSNLVHKAQLKYEQAIALCSPDLLVDLGYVSSDAPYVSNPTTMPSFSSAPQHG
ncbi:heptaprenyl diphosphate synthase component 1 [Paenibacillus sp. ACRRX]|uniref:heptaprenyl diphosphate synthase component 1 n=1 Tax=unclassified Paenibacillus TaxID=185978 RepID=UPI001EF5D382|nr:MULTISPECIES: heptaprenyl diphosphate synthase component 1 [unclassified Paenibacillus]MCG7406446.1 heptaprenyl diphosphate synthase component 1 [Paenibacillus sp. ACRRX]MDK8179478.1 heptaprenyl diphosphate synthase component 1 [Paenibacillus sp. UMB4589-SE434]